jgi:hypothetical protein
MVMPASEQSKHLKQVSQLLACVTFAGTNEPDKVVVEFTRPGGKT